MGFPSCVEALTYRWPPARGVSSDGKTCNIENATQSYIYVMHPSVCIALIYNLNVQKTFSRAESDPARDHVISEQIGGEDISM